ncbi:MAG: HD domain-containing phosphohydrolase [Gammaproteobacteria bacterium]|nr:HD domain-containing phosphohydrolase [Gammaproteobacteria bacterium]
MDSETSTLLERLRRLNDIGVALSAEGSTERLLERILESAKELTNADGGTLYLRGDEDSLYFEIMLNESLGIRLGGTSGEAIGFDPLPLYDEAGRPNHTMVAAHAALEKVTVNIPDAYEVEAFDLSGTRAFDTKTGYRSKSFLTVPMVNHEGRVIGVLQLINARSGGTVVPFSAEDQQLVESLSSQAAVALTNKRLIDAQRRLFEAFIELIAGAIDDKSPYTGGHCRRVPELTMMLADAASRAASGPLADFAMTEEDRYELKIAGWLHDCGKVTTPEYVVDKSTKLETIHDRIHEVDARFEVLKRDAAIRMLQRVLAAQARGEWVDHDAEQAGLQTEMAALQDDRDFLRTSNVGGEFMSDEDIERIRRIARYRWKNAAGREVNLLTEDELHNLCIRKGTLTEKERGIINHHIVATIKMLEALPFPSYLKNVPEYAGGHHERMDGRGYPKGLTREQMSVQARVMGIADIFEALTARDRPYKPGMKLSRALEILCCMREDHHIDPDIFEVFVREGVYLDYARRFLEPEQIDEVDHDRLLGKAAP